MLCVNLYSLQYILISVVNGSFAHCSKLASCIMNTHAARIPWVSLLIDHITHPHHLHMCRQNIAHHVRTWERLNARQRNHWPTIIYLELAFKCWNVHLVWRRCSATVKLQSQRVQQRQKMLLGDSCKPRMPYSGFSCGNHQPKTFFQIPNVPQLPAAFISGSGLQSVHVLSVWGWQQMMLETFGISKKIFSWWFPQENPEWCNPAGQASSTMPYFQHCTTH